MKNIILKKIETGEFWNLRIDFVFFMIKLFAVSTDYSGSFLHFDVCIKNEMSSMYEESRLLDGSVVSQAKEYKHNSNLPQVT